MGGHLNHGSKPFGGLVNSSMARLFSQDLLLLVLPAIKIYIYINQH